MFEGNEIDDFESNLFASLKPSKPKIPSKQKVEGDSKKLFDINDDELLDLLSDDISPDPAPAVTDTVKQKEVQSGTNEDLNALKQGSLSQSLADNADEGLLDETAYTPSNIKTRRPILKNTSNTSLTEVGRKTSAVRFVDEIVATSDDDQTELIKDKNALQNLTNITPVSDVQLSSTPTSNTTASSVSSTPVSSTPVSNGLLSSAPVSNVSSTPVSITPASSRPVFNSNDSKTSNILETANDEEPLFSSTDNKMDDSLQFGSYVPSSNTPRHAAGRRRRSLPTSTPSPSTERKNSRKSFSGIAKDPTTASDSKTTQLDLNMSTTPTTHENEVIQDSYSSLIHQNKSSSNDSPKQLPLSHVSLSTAPPLSHDAPMSVEAIPVRTSLFNTHPMTATEPSISSVQVSQLEKQLMEYMMTLDKTVKQQHEDLVNLKSTEAKLDAMEMEKQMLMKSLEDAKDELTKEKQLLKEYIQSVDAQVKGLRHEIEESNHTNENRLRQELVEVKKRHEEEIKSLRQEQEESLMHWKSLAAHQTEQKAIIDRLHETQLRLLESVQSLDRGNSAAFHKLHTDLSDKLQFSVKQITDFYSTFTASQSLQQNATTEALFEKLATRQKEQFFPLLQKMDDFMENDKSTVSKLEASLLAERKAIEEERAKITLQTQQEKDALQKQKDHFFSEQQAWLSDNYSEKHHMMKVQAIANETFTRNQKLETELNCMKVSLEKERNSLSLEQSKLMREREQLEQEKLKLNESRQAVLALEQNLKMQATQVNETSQMTQQVYLEGQQTLIAAKEMQKALNKKLAGLQTLETSGISIQDQIKQQSMMKSKSNTDVLSIDEDHLAWCPETETCSHSVSNTLLQLQHNQSIRDNLNELKKDDEKLEKETEFLHLIQIGRKTV